MKVKDIISRVDKSVKFKTGVNSSEIMRGMCIDNFVDIYNVKEERLTCYFIGNWLCTDRHVGYRVYFFDDKPVAISHQGARKSDEDISWLSIEDFRAVEQYFISLQISDESPSIDVIDPESEFEDSYKIVYHESLLPHHYNIPLCHGAKVKIFDRHRGSGYNSLRQYEPSLVKIKFENGDEEWIELKELDFPFSLIQ